MKKLLLILACISIYTAIAQNGFTTYTTNLAINNAVNNQSSFLVDESGNKWIGFNGTGSGLNVGLVKFDNTNWTLFNTSSSPSLPTNNITSLAQDSIGNLWIGTDSGLVKYNGSQFTRYTVADGLPTNQITSVDAKGKIVYIGSLKGISKFDGVGFINYNMANSALANDSVFSIKIQSKSTVWLGGNNRLMRHLSGASFSIFGDYPMPNSGVTNCIATDLQGQKWIGTTNLGLLIFNGTSFVNATSIYSIPYSCSIPKTVYNIINGFNNGFFLKLVGNSNSNTSVGFVELAPNNMIYQYLNFNSESLVLGDYFQKQGNKLLISQGGQNLNYAHPKMYYEFDPLLYKNTLTKVDSNNFKTLDINNVRAGIANRGDMHWDIGGSGNALYEVPKGSGINSNFATALWIGGLDNANQLHGGAQTYRQGGVDFWPGPLDTVAGTIDATTSANYDKIWKVSYTDINNFINAFNSGSVVATPDMLTWPAKGTGNNSRNLAPYVDFNHDGNYNPNDGDYPKIKGDQTLYFIYNDMLSTHSTSFTPMGVEVQGMAYAYGCPTVVSGKPELSYTTFYDYKIINRSSNNYHDVYVSMWNDVDLGYYGDDYVGCNVADNYGYAYNADGDDEVNPGTPGYHNYIPAQGFAIVKGPLANILDGIDNNNNAIADEIGEDCKLNKFNYFNNSLPGVPITQTHPDNGAEYYNMMTGKWRDGTPFTCGGNGYGGTITTNWAYSGDPNNTGVDTDPNNTCGNWTEATGTVTPGDRRMILSSGPFNLHAGQMQEVEYAFVTSFDSSSTTNSNMLSVAKLKTDIQKVNAFYNQVNKPSCLQAINVGVTKVVKQNDFALFPNPAKSVITISAAISGNLKINYEIVDVIGKVVLQNENEGANKFTININEFNSGIYFLRLQVNNSVVVKKFVKE